VRVGKTNSSCPREVGRSRSQPSTLSRRRRTRRVIRSDMSTYCGKMGVRLGTS
jgi:hypothetical protein